MMRLRAVIVSPVAAEDVVRVVDGYGDQRVRSMETAVGSEVGFVRGPKCTDIS
jgi:hypothetical protein